MEKSKFEEKLNYTNELMVRLDKIANAMERGETGSVELGTLHMLVAEPIMNPIKPEIEKIEEQHANKEAALLESWKEPDGHRLNNKYKIVMTPERTAQKIQLRIIANQLIVNKIVTALYNAGMLLTSATNMPSSLVR